MVSRCNSFAVALAALLVVTSAQADDARTPDSLPYAQQLMERVNTLYREGHYSEAIPIAERAVVIREKMLGPDHVDTAASLDALGLVSRFAADFPLARRSIEQALAIREKILGREDIDTAQSINNLGGLCFMISDFAQAEKLYRRALAIREKKLGSKHPATAMSVHHLAIAIQSIGDYAQAERLLRRALSIMESVSDRRPDDYLDVVRDLGALYVDVGAVTLAEPLLQRALVISENAFGKEHPATAIALDTLAGLYYATGAFEQAKQLFLRSIAIHESTRGSDHPFVMTTITRLALLYARTGDYTRAESLHLRTLSVREKAFGRESREVIYTLSNLAELYMTTGDYDHARPLLIRTLAIKEKIFSPDHHSIATSLHNLAVLYAHTGAFDKAEPLFQRALAVYEKSLNPGHRYVLDTVRAYAALKWAQGEPTEALGYLRRAQLAQSANNSQFLTTGSETRKQAYLRELALSTSEDVTFSVAYPSRDSATLALNSLFEYKGRILEAMFDSASQLRQRDHDADATLFDQRAQLAGEYSTLIYRGGDEVSAEEYRRRVSDLSVRLEKLDAELAEHSQLVRNRVIAPSVADIRRYVPTNAALVEFFRYVPFDPKGVSVNGLQLPTDNGPRYVAYVMRHNGDPISVDVCDAREIEAAVQEFRLSLSDPKRIDFNARAAKLSELLLKPLSPHLQGVEHLLVSPDGILNLVPMAALVDERGDYLAQRFEITYLTSGRDLLHMGAVSASHRSAVVMADPRFGTSENATAFASPTLQAQRSLDLDRSGMIFRPLAGTAVEAEDLKRLLRLDSTNVLVREDATEGRLKQLHGPRILHIATHGFFLTDKDLASELSKRNLLGAESFDVVTENPLLRSGLALSGANARRSGEDDGILTALEAAQLDLRGTDLVVLSACDSGVGEVQNGEGVYGLRRALVLAGAQTQVTSLWKVSDEATRKLMVDFYQHLLKGEGRSEALRHAQLAVLAKSELSHPYYWASFISIGNWTPLSAML